MTHTILLLRKSWRHDRLQIAALQSLRHFRLWLGVMGLSLLGACGGGGSSGGIGDQVLDTSVPTLSITSDAPSSARAPFKLTFTFSGPVTFPASDGILSWATNNTNATANRSTFTQVSATQYTVTVTPVSSAKGNWTLTVPAGGYKNQGGNASNTTAVAVTQAIDAAPPIGTFSATVPSGQLAYIGPTTVTLRFDLPLDADLTLDKLVLSSTSFSTGVATAAGIVSNLVKTSAPGALPVYTFLYTPASGSNSVNFGLAPNAVFSGSIPNATNTWLAWFVGS
jgi:hypothetical protein